MSSILQNASTITNKMEGGDETVKSASSRRKGKKKMDSAVQRAKAKEADEAEGKARPSLSSSLWKEMEKEKMASSGGQLELSAEEEEEAESPEIAAAHRKPDGSFTLRDWIAITMTTPSFNLVAKIYFIATMIAILTSIVAFLVETQPKYWADGSPALTALETIIVGFFTFDYVVRLVVTRTPRWRWFREPLNIVDLLSILPFYIELIVAATGAEAKLGALLVIRILRIFRLARLFKAAKFSLLFSVIGETFKRSLSALGLLWVGVGVAVLIFSAIQFYGENLSIATFDEDALVWYYPDGSESHFQSVTETLYWGLITVTTVGYGDLYPSSPIGRIVAAITVLVGLLVLAFPVIVIGNEFTDVWNRYANSEKSKERIWMMRRARETSDAADLQAALQEELDQLAAEIDNMGGQLDSMRQRWLSIASFSDAIYDIQARDKGVAADGTQLANRALGKEKKVKA